VDLRHNFDSVDSLPDLNDSRFPLVEGRVWNPVQQHKRELRGQHVPQLDEGLGQLRLELECLVCIHLALDRHPLPEPESAHVLEPADQQRQLFSATNDLAIVATRPVRVELGNSLTACQTAQRGQGQLELEPTELPRKHQLSKYKFHSQELYKCTRHIRFQQW